MRSVLLILLIFIFSGSGNANEKSRGLVKMGEHLLDDGNLNQALEVFIRAKEADTKDATAWNNTGLTYLLKKQYKEAIPFLEKALSLAPHCNIYTNLGVAYFEAGDKEKSQSTFQQGFQTCQENERMKQWHDHLNKPTKSQTKQ